MAHRTTSARQRTLNPNRKQRALRRLSLAAIGIVIEERRLIGRLVWPVRLSDTEKLLMGRNIGRQAETGVLGPIGQTRYDQPVAGPMNARITIDPNICHDKPTIRGLRYPVETILELLGSGMTTDEILSPDWNVSSLASSLIFRRSNGKLPASSGFLTASESWAASLT